MPRILSVGGNLAFDILLRIYIWKSRFWQVVNEIYFFIFDSRFLKKYEIKKNKIESRNNQRKAQINVDFGTLWLDANIIKIVKPHKIIDNPHSVNKTIFKTFISNVYLFFLSFQRLASVMLGIIIWLINWF